MFISFYTFCLGELIGGLDIVREMERESELKDVIPQIEKEEDINERIKASLSIGGNRYWELNIHDIKIFVHR